MVELASAWITIAATTRGMESDIRRALEQVEKSAKLSPQIDRSAFGREGDRAARDFASRFEAASGRGGGAAGKKVASAFVGGFTAVLAGGALTSAAEAAVASFRSIIDTGMDFSKTTNNFQGVTRSTAAEMARMQSAARSLGQDTTLAGASASSAAAAMTELAKAGFTVDQAIGSARGTLELATAGQIDAAKAAEIQANAMNAFEMPKGLQTAAHVADLLANAAVASSADIPDLGEALQQVGGIAHGFGENLDDTIAALGVFANAGVKGSDAGTLLKTTMQAITDQGSPAQGAIKDLGLELYKLNGQGQNQFVGFRELFKQLDEAKKRINDPEIFQAQTNILFGSDAMRSAMLGNADAFNQMLANVERVGGASELAGAQMQGLPGAVEGFKNAVEGIQLGAFEALGPALSAGMGGFVDWLSSHQADVSGFFKTLGDAALSTGTVVLSVFGSMAGTASDLARAFGANGVADSLNFAAEAAQQGLNAIDRGHAVLDQYGARAQAAGQFVDALGISVKSLKADTENVTLDVKDNTPEIQEKLRALGAHLVALDNDPTRLKIVADTVTASDRINAWRAQQTGVPLNVSIAPNLDLTQAKNQVALFAQQLQAVTLAPQVVLPPGMSRPGQPSPFGGVPIPRSVGAIVPMASGGLTGISKPQTAGLYAGRGAGTIFAEQETGGEAYIPLAPGKRSRSRRILSEVARLFGMNVMEDGGITVETLKQLASGASGGSYVRGGPPGLSGSDCSGLQAFMANAITGGSGRFATGNEGEALASRGFMQGDPPPGVAAYWIGWKNGGPGGGHTAGTILDPNGGNVNVEMGGAAGGGQYGGSAAGASSFPNRAWIQIAGGEDPNAASNFSSGAGSTAAVQSASAGVTSARGSVTSAQASLDQADAAVSEAKSTGASADKVATAEKKRDAAQQKLTAAQERQTAAETRLTEVKEKAAGQGEKSSGGFDSKSLFSSLLGGIGETIGIPNFANILDSPNYKSIAALGNFGLGLLGSATGDQSGPGDPLGSALGGSIGLPALSNLLQPQGPQALSPIDPNMTAHGGAGAAAPGPTFNVTANGMDPKAVVDKQNHTYYQAYRSNLSAVRPK